MIKFETPVCLIIAERSFIVFINFKDESFCKIILGCGKNVSKIDDRLSFLAVLTN